MNRSLNVRQERFAEFVSSGMPATRAYMEAGYSQDLRIAKANACRLMDNDGVKALIAKLRAPQTQAATFTKEEVLTFLVQIIQTPIGEIGPESPLCGEYSEVIICGGNNGRHRRCNKDQGNEIVTEPILRRRVKSQDKLRALELYAKHQGYFAPETVIVEDGPEKLKSARERALTIASPLNRLRSHSAPVEKINSNPIVTP